METTELAQALLRSQQDIAFAAGALRTPRPAGSGLGMKKDEAGLTVRERPSDSAGWNGGPGIARFKTGSAPGRYDPHPTRSLLRNFYGAHAAQLNEAIIAQRWPAAVGPQIAEHTEIIKIEGTRVTVRATSTTWAKALQVNLGNVLRRLEQECGAGVVETVIVIGPSAQRSWQHGPKSVRGRGVRDTYG